MMRPQDILVISKIIVAGETDWKQTDLAEALLMSQSEISASLRRSDRAHLLNKQEKILYPRNVLDFMVYGFSYVFPVELGPVGKGVPTALSHPLFLESFPVPSIPFVWAAKVGDTLGQSIAPLHPRQAEAALKDEGLYQLLACLDVIRMGNAREKQVAMLTIESLMQTYEQQVSLVYQ
jgi:hypothetical protein